MEDDRELGPTYKSLALGACLIIGGTFGWWLTNFISTVEGLQKDYAQLATRVAILEWQRDNTKPVKADNGTEQSVARRAGHVPEALP